MRRIRQESAEIYVVSPTEIATALGLYMCESDTVTLEKMYGDVYRIRISAVTEESYEIEVPCPDAEQPEFARLCEVVAEIPVVSLPPLLPGVALAPDLATEWRASEEGSVADFMEGP